MVWMYYIIDVIHDELCSVVINVEWSDPSVYIWSHSSTEPARKTNLKLLELLASAVHAIFL